MGFVYEAFDPQLERKVALKLLRTTSQSPEARTRLLREAQAMAQLSDPYVVPVFDVGTTEGGDVFLAMERIDGQTLSEWCASERDWRAILRYFLYAGRGLAAAHAAGMVHRDFKPHNVLVAKDGRVRVTDFGLVRRVEDAEVPHTPGPPDGAPLGEPLTRAGAIVGTPHYMAPEQLSGETVDPRADQFSFCIALYEALYRERPFRGEELHVLLAQQKLDQVRDAPKGTRVPQWVRKALLRGLRSAPEQRFPSMSGLLAALGRDPARTLRRVGIACALGLLAVTLVTVQLLRLRREGPCAHAADGIARVWNDTAHATLAAAYRATGKAFAEDALRALDSELSRYTQRWTALAQTTCQAAQVQRQIPEAIYDRQRDCLEERRRELSAFVRLLSQSDAATLANGARSVQALAPLEECGGEDAPTVKRSAEWAVHPAELAALRAGLAETDARNALGHYREAVALVGPTLAKAPHLGETPAAAELLRQQGVAQYRLGDAAAAAQSFEQAALISERYGNDGLAAKAWLGSGLSALYLAHYPDATRFLAFAKAKLDRVGEANGAVQLRWLHGMSLLDYHQGRYAESAAKLRATLADRTLPWSPSLESAAREQLANAEKELGDDRAAADDYARAIALTKHELGPNHPRLAQLYGELAVIRHHQKRDGEARTLFRHALDLDEAFYGKDSMDSASWLNNLAVLESDEGHGEAALALLHQVLEIKTRVLGGDHPSVATSLINEATALIELKRYGEAEQDLTRAAAVLIASKGDDHPDLIAVYTDLGAALRHQGRYPEADASLRRAVAIAQKRLPPNHPWLSQVWSGLAENELKQHRYRPAAEAYERALAVDAARAAGAADSAGSKFGLAQALMKLRRDPTRALSLANEALLAARKAPLPDSGPSAKEIERWLHAQARIVPGR